MVQYYLGKDIGSIVNGYLGTFNYQNVQSIQQYAFGKGVICKIINDDDDSDSEYWIAWENILHFELFRIPNIVYHRFQKVV